MPPDDAPPTITSFPSLDEAEGALDWIGLEFSEGEGWFEGELDEDAAEQLEATVNDKDAPIEVRSLAAALLARWRDDDAPRAWRVAFPA